MITEEFIEEARSRSHKVGTKMEESRRLLIARSVKPLEDSIKDAITSSAKRGRREGGGRFPGGIESSIDLTMATLALVETPEGVIVEVYTKQLQGNRGLVHVFDVSF